MNILIFNRSYTLRRFGQPVEKNGYLHSSHLDMKVSIHVHPAGGDSVQNDGAGGRVSRHLEGHGNIRLNVADQNIGTKADCLYYHGDWYECVSCQYWDHTILTHYNYSFTLIPQDSELAHDIGISTRQ